MTRVSASVVGDVLVVRIVPQGGRVPTLRRDLLGELSAHVGRLATDDALVGAVVTGAGPPGAIASGAATPGAATADATPSGADTPGATPAGAVTPGAATPGATPSGATPSGAGPAGRAAPALDADPGRAHADTFVAGADVRDFLDFVGPAEVRAVLAEGHALLGRLERSPKPVVAAIDGACMGGGLELALACRAVIASDRGATRFGLPEVRLGLTPGLGGTQRLPRRIGASAALGMALSGRTVHVREARRLGLVDAVVHPEGLEAAALRAVRELASGAWAPKRSRRALAARLLDGRLGRALLWRLAARRAQREGRGHYPAPARILSAVRVGVERGATAGFEAEAQAFSELLFTPEARALIHLFLARGAARRNPWVAEARPVRRVGVVGCGLMGGGIAQISASAGLEVRAKDRDLGLAAQARRATYRGATGRVGRGVSAVERDRIVERVTPVAAYADLAAVDLTIEAVVERADLKREVRAAVERVTGAHHVYASNTSSIPIARIAEGAARPEAILGMHYFSPVARMPLLEVVRTPATAAWALGTAVATGLRQGKVVIVVGDGPGFYTTRVLARYTAEALELLQEGADLTVVDGVMTRYGFPLGPFALLDDVGLDVAAEIQAVMEGTVAAGDRRRNGMLARLVAQGFVGRKGRKGFYRYRGGRRGHEVDRSVYVASGLGGRRRVPADGVRERLELAFVNEAVRCLDDGILGSPTDGDVGAVFGLGFPPFRGGPFHLADAVGAAVLVERLRRLEAAHGERFAPADGLVRRAASGDRFLPG